MNQNMNMGEPNVLHSIKIEKSEEQTISIEALIQRFEEKINQQMLCNRTFMTEMLRQSFEVLEAKVNKQVEELSKEMILHKKEQDNKAQELEIAVNGVQRQAQDVEEIGFLVSEHDHRIELLETKANLIVEEVGALQKGLEDDVHYLNEQIEGHAKAVHEMHCVSNSHFQEIDERVDEVFAGDFTTIIDNRVRTIVEELVCNIRMLTGKMDKISAAPVGKARLEQLEDSVVRLQGATESLNAAQRDIDSKLSLNAFTSLRMERSIGELKEHLETQGSVVHEQVRGLTTSSAQEEPVEWFQDVEMGSETLNGYSLMRGKDSRTKDKRNKQKKSPVSKRKASHDEDPSSSDDSSTSSSSSDSDDSGRPRKARKRGSDSDSSTESDESSDHKRSRKGSNRRKSKLLDPKYFGAGRKRASIIGGDEPSGTSSGRGSSKRHSAQDSIIFVQPTPVVQTLKLSSVSVGKVMYFCKTFNSESSRFRGGLNASNYIDDRLLCQMRQVALKHDLPGEDGILSNGRQKITNKEIFAILAMMVAPTSKEEMQRQLSKSVWPQKNDYKTVDQIMKSILEYKTELLIYVDRFEDKVKLLGYHDCSAKYIPKTLFKKGGGDPGLADYFISGLPDKNFGMRVWVSVNEDKRKKCDEWRKFVKLYMRAVELMEKREKDKEINRQICLGVKEMIKTEPTSKSYTYKGVERNADSSRVQSMCEEGELASDEEIEIVFSKEREGEDLLSDIEQEEGDFKMDGSALHVTFEDLSQLANALQPTDTKKVGVCYDVLYRGKCDKKECPYSHKEEDIRKAKELKALRLDTPAKTPDRSGTPTRGPNQALRRT